MRDFGDCKRIVIKIGTTTLSRGDEVDTSYFEKIALQVKSLIDKGKQVIIVTSGSIGMGAGQLRLKTRVINIHMRQACAAIGQPLLMNEYRKAFLAQNLLAAQVLLTADVLSQRKTYVNLRNAIESLLKLGVIPVINENDCVSTAEIDNTFGDNDKLSALVSSKVDADLLIMLTDIDALYDKDPRIFPEARPIPMVRTITDEIMKNAGGSGSTHSVGGMKTKIVAARILHNTGCRLVLADGKTADVITRILAGEELGTLFIPRQKVSNRVRWILNSKTAGRIVVDEGALQAIRSRKSLLPSGITAVEGIFNAGCVVSINNQAKALVNFSSEELKMLIGRHTSEIRKILGENKRDVVAIPEDIVFLEHQ